VQIRNVPILLEVVTCILGSFEAARLIVVLFHQVAVVPSRQNCFFRQETSNQPVYLLYAAFIAASIRSGEEVFCT